MNEQLDNFRAALQKSWINFYEALPSIVFAILIFAIGLLIIRKLKGLAYSFIDKRSKDPLVSDFLVNVIALILTILLLVISLSILGLGEITDKILAGAGITTFIIGFALKDIGENFLSGIIMAFKRPFRIGDLIEIDGFKGKVTNMSLRETLIKTLDGKEVFIPNGLIAKNGLVNYTLDDLLRTEFVIGLDYNDNTEEALQVIESILQNEEGVLQYPEPFAVIDELATSTVNVRVSYWYMTNDIKVPGVKLKSNIMLKVFKSLLDKGFGLPSDIVEVKMLEK
ncbi:mechanosensitive ion channel family protein [Flavobacterium sp. NRK F7]|uniref:mechanosensitive ion channel family protein n=1 Tax=Flavobacterium sp. NRK F7 TaxID=2954930 RepID=UPI00209033FC|nr:mechanosensitive ion channel family protein [Flavobacterium sp. NRK F7]MCO6163620.1 mechanosensitive ion channel family protein [Flavobacterium sp. NRK F7]